MRVVVVVLHIPLHQEQVLRQVEVGVEEQVPLTQLTHQIQFLEPILPVGAVGAVLIPDQVQTVVPES
jgi:hypothetical protein